MGNVEAVQQAPMGEISRFNKLQELTISEGRLSLDGHKMSCVSEWKLEKSPADPRGIAELTIKMLVRFSGNRPGQDPSPSE